MRKLLEASEPLSLPQILEGVESIGSLSFAISKACLDLGQILLHDDTMDDTSEHGVVLIRCQVRNGLSSERLHRARK